MNSNYLDNYGPLLLMFILACGLAGALVVVSTLIGKHKRSREKDQPYECGIRPTGDAREPISVQFYMVAIAVYFVRYRGNLSVSLGAGLQRSEGLRFCGDASLHYNFTGRLHLPLEEGRARLESLSGRPSGNELIVQAQDADKSPVVHKLKEWDGQAVSEVLEFRGEITVVVPREHLKRIADYLATEPSLRFSFLSDITPVDRFPIEPRFEINYHLVSIDRRDRLRLKVKLAGNDPVLPSVTGVWPTANWHEREAYDLFGIRFEGHPDLRRILMPDDWEGHPLRKDYPTEGYR